MGLKRSVSKSKDVGSSNEERGFVSPTNGSSARKFTSLDSVESFSSDAGSTKNSTHIVSQASGLKAVAVVGAASAKTARDNLRAARQALSAADPSSVSRPRGQTSPDSKQLSLQQDDHLRSIADQVKDSSVFADDSNRLDAAADEVVKSSLRSFLPVAEKSSAQTVNPSSPELDRIEISVDPTRGLHDAFTAELRFSVPRNAVAAGQVVAIRIFRAVVEDPSFFQRAPVVLSTSALERLCARPLRTHIKNRDYLAQFERQLVQMGIANAISETSPVDPVRGIRYQTFSGSLSVPFDQGGNASDISRTNAASFVSSRDLGGLDRSVSTDLRSLKNIAVSQGQESRIPSGTVAVGSYAVVGRGGRVGVAAQRQARSAFSSGGGRSVAVQGQGFSELTMISPDKLKGEIVGDFIQYSYVDSTVSYGRSFRYYMTTVDRNMVDSGRSQIVQVDVEGLRVPLPPDVFLISYSLGAVSINASSGDRLVEKFEIYRKEVGIAPSKVEPTVSSVVSSDGSSFLSKKRDPLPSGFVQVGEFQNVLGAGGSLRDTRIKPGKRYIYRIYSVDLFGNKSVEPSEKEIFCQVGRTTTDLIPPEISVEVDSATNFGRITMRCTDSRVTHLFLARRDVGIGQSGFVTPGQIERIKHGGVDPIRTRSRADDVRFGNDADKKLLWNGVFENSGDVIVFVDKSMTAERIYQYKVYGCDRYGNQTSHVFSPRTMMTLTKVLDAPTNVLSALVSDGQDISGVSLSWDNPNVDIGSEDRVGDRDVFAANSVKSLYQVSRKEANDHTWTDFSLVEGNSFFDPVLTSQPLSVTPSFSSTKNLSRSERSAATRTNVGGAPSARQFLTSSSETDGVRLGSTYAYRVQVFQSGGLVSNFSKEVSVTVVSPVPSPQNFRVRSGDTRVRPYVVALNWDTPRSSGPIDRWEVERASLNNVAAARLNSSNPADFASLSFSPLTSVHLESSRFRERTDDEGDDGSSSAAGSLLTGQHHFLDMDVDFGNSYFYRIRAVSSQNAQVSPWVYRGIRVTDESFERQQRALVSPDEFTKLSSGGTVRSAKRQRGEKGASSYSLKPRR